VQLLLATQPWNLEQLGTLSLSGLQVGAILYLFVPLVAGFLVANQRASALAGIGAGCLVGGLAFLISALSGSVLFSLLTLDSCPTHYPCISSRAVFVIGIIFYIEGAGGIFGGALGGIIGGFLG